MSRNIEIKAVARDFERQQAEAGRLAGKRPELLEQRDTFFCVPHGRLKLREFSDGRGELIQYERADQCEAKTSNYTVAGVDQPQPLRRALADALGIRGEVVKRRWLYLVGPTRIHFDEVEGLGQFIELEVVMGESTDDVEGHAMASRLMKTLNIAAADLIDCAYIDLLEQNRKKPSHSV